MHQREKLQRELLIKASQHAAISDGLQRRSPEEERRHTEQRQAEKARIEASWQKKQEALEQKRESQQLVARFRQQAELEQSEARERADQDDSVASLRFSLCLPAL